MRNQIIEKLLFWAETYPYKTAVQEENRSINYRTLISDVSKTVAWLKQKNIEKEDIAAVCMERCYESVCVTLGIIAAGAAFLPIDVKLPPDRIKYMLDKSNAKCVITKGDFDNIGAFFNKCDIEKLLKGPSQKAGVPVPKTADEDLAYVVFTSGSTGRPKGVMIEYAGMQNHLQAKIDILGLNDKSVIAHNASISFDISVWQVLCPVYVGGTIRVFSEKEVMYVKKLLYGVKKDGVTVLEVVPSYLNLMIKAAKKIAVSFPELSYVLCTGEVLPNDLVRRWFECFTVPLVNAYGPTEASDDVTHYFLHKEQKNDVIPIGKPIANARLYIVDPSGKQCSTGEYGELCIAGICVGRGYMKDTGETEKYFGVDEKTGQRLYRTGDVAAYCADGNYRFGGRIDTQIKIHGFRIEVKEIESVIEENDGVLEAMVIYLKEEDTLAAGYISKKFIPADELMQHMEEKLPKYMIPVQIFRVNEIPHNLNGKIDYGKGKGVLHQMQKQQRREKLEKNIIGQIFELIHKTGHENRIKDNENDLRMMGLSSLSMIDLMVELEAKFNLEMDDKLFEGGRMFDLKSIAGFISDELIKREENRTCQQ